MVFTDRGGLAPDVALATQGTVSPTASARGESRAPVRLGERASTGVMRGLIDAARKSPARSGQGTLWRRGDRVVIQDGPAGPGGPVSESVPGIDALAHGAPHLELLSDLEHAAVDGIVPVLDVPQGLAGILLEVVDPPRFGARESACRVVIEEGSWRGRQVWLTLPHIGRLPAAHGSLSEQYQEELRRTLERRQAREAQRSETRVTSKTPSRKDQIPPGQPLLGQTPRPADTSPGTPPRASAEAPAKSPGNTTSTICGAPTRSGAPCQRKVKGGGRCYQHRE